MIQCVEFIVSDGHRTDDDDGTDDGTNRGTEDNDGDDGDDGTRRDVRTEDGQRRRGERRGGRQDERTDRGRRRRRRDGHDGTGRLMYIAPKFQIQLLDQYSNVKVKRP